MFVAARFVQLYVYFYGIQLDSNDKYRGLPGITRKLLPYGTPGACLHVKTIELRLCLLVQLQLVLCTFMCTFMDSHVFSSGWGRGLLGAMSSLQDPFPFF